MASLLCLLGCTATNQDLHLVVHGANYQWYIRYPGSDGKLYSTDDLISRQHIVVPAQTPLRLTLTSRDYLYTFRIPQLDRKQMAVPELFFKLDFPSGPPGNYVLKGDQMCGFAHQSLIGDFKVVNSKEFIRWTKTLKPPQAYPEAPELLNPPIEHETSGK